MDIRRIETVIGSEEFQDKSLQGQIFYLGRTHSLKGDQDQIHFPVVTKTSKAKENQNASQKHLEINEQNSFQHDESVSYEQINVKINIFQNQLGEKESEQSSVNGNINNLQPKNQILFENKCQNMHRISLVDISLMNESKQSTGNIQMEKSEENFKVELSMIEKCTKSPIKLQNSKRSSDPEISKLHQLNTKSKITPHRNIQQNMRRQSIESLEKAIPIINKIHNKNMNRPQRINSLVKKFICMLKIRKNNRQISHSLQENQYKIINDYAFFINSTSKNFIVNNYFYKLINLAMSNTKVLPYVFMPTNTFRVYWDILQTIYTYLFIYIYSILLFFAMQEQDSILINQYYKFSFILFMIDILVTFNTAFFKQDVVITNRKQIAWKYMTSSIFITDAISLITMGSKLILANSNLVYNPDHSVQSIAINSLVFLKLKCLSQKKKRFSQVFILKDNQKHIMKLLNQLFIVFFIAHFVSLAWNILGKYEIYHGYEISWIKKYNFDELTYLQLYVYCMYWSFTTMTTVGYGDITASNYVEALFISISMILFSCVFAYSINSIGFILQEIEKSSKELNDSIIVIQRYLNRKNVNSSLQSRVRHYLSFLAKEQKDRDQESEKQILQILSKKLRNEIVIEINSRVLKNFSIFSRNFSSQTLRKLVFLMEEVVVSPNEIVFEQGEIQDQSIYFVESGRIEIYQSGHESQVSHNQNTKPKTHSIKIIQRESIFGEISFFSGMARNSCARSLNLSTLYKIDRNKFICLIKENQEDFEIFKMIEEQLRVLQDNSFLFLECFVCKNKGHIAKDCPTVHQKFDSQFLILKHNFSLFQERNIKIQRNLYKYKCSARMNISKNKNICNALKSNIRYFNSKTEIQFKTDYEIQSQEFDTDYFSSQEKYASSGYSSQSSEKEEDSSRSINDKFIFKSDRSIRELQANNNNLRVVKSQIYIGKPSSLLRNQRDSIKPNQILESQENLLQSEKQNNEPLSMNLNQSGFYQKDNLHISENQLEFNNHSDELIDNDNNKMSQAQFQTTQNESKAPNSNTIGNSHISLQEINEEKQKNISKQQTVKFNNLNQDDCNCSNSNRDDNSSQKYVSYKTFKSSKTAKSLKTKEFEKPQLEKILSKEIMSAYIAQSLALLNTQNQLNKFENSMSKLEDKVQSISSQKLNLSLERNMIKNKNSSTMFSTISKRQESSQEQRLSDLVKQDFDSNDDSIKFQRQTNKNLGFQQQNQLEQSNSLKMLQKVCKMLSSKGADIYNLFSHLENDEDNQDNLIFDNFDALYNFKKFLPHNNFCNIIKTSNYFAQFRHKKSSASIKSTRSRRKNNLFIKQSSKRKSLFCNQVMQIQIHQQTDYLKFKPSFLSYGVSQKKDTFPKFYLF